MMPSAIQTIPQAIAWWAEQTPEATALLSGSEHSEPVSFGQLNDRAAALAGYMATRGINRGDLVAIDADNRVDAVVAIVAAMRIGAALPLIPGASGSEVDAIFSRLNPALCIVADRAEPSARAALAANVPILLVSGGSSGPVDDPGATISCDDLALVLHSSGTTGNPRGIPRTHRNLLAAASAYAAWVGPEALARVLVTTPLSFGMGAHALCATLCAGGAAILAGNAPGDILRAIDRWQPTWAYVVPALLEAILDEVGQTRRLPSSDWQPVGVAGMAPSRTLADRFEAAFGVPLVEGYGCGEAGLIAGSTNAGERFPGLLHRVYTAGIATLDEHGSPTPRGMPGEIVVWGPQVSAAYIGDLMETTASFTPEGGFYTGDVGVLDGTGALRLVGRVKEIINRGGEKLAPAEIEAALLTHPAVVEAAVFPVSDARLGEEVVAAVVVRPVSVAAERDLRRHAARVLSPAKVPRRIWIVDTLPRTATGKIRRGDLASRYGPVWRADPSG